MLVGWSRDHLAEAADVAMHTIMNWENETSEPRAATIARVVKALEDRGVEFTNGGQPGVRLKAKRDHASASE
jgi:DNA-binding XRE family transcriptional regulator